MNKITTLAAISMFAVIMGMSAFAPALATPKGNSGNADTIVCHYFVVYQTDEFGELLLDESEMPIVDEELSSWNLLYVSNQGAVNGHEKHGDEIYEDVVDDIDSCAVNQDGTFSTLVV